MYKVFDDKYIMISVLKNAIITLTVIRQSYFNLNVTTTNSLLLGNMFIGSEVGMIHSLFYFCPLTYYIIIMNK